MVVTATMLGVLPVFLLGGLAVQVRDDLNLTEAGLGIATATFFAASALFSLPGGRLSERIGGERGLLVGAVASLVALLGVATLARSLLGLLVFIGVSGIGNGVTQPSANLALARRVRVGRQGVAFGIKQSAIPGATLLGGLAVPFVALTVGWRWAYGGGAAAAALFALWALSRALVSGPSRPVRRARAGRGDVRSLLPLAVAGGLASAAANSMAAFLVVGGVTAGLAPGAAGLLFAAGSGSSIAVRVTLGWLADRRTGDALGVVGALLLTGGIGFAALATGLVPWLYVAGALVGFGAGWAWPGLFNLAIVRAHPEAPAAATGLTQTGVYAGGVLGPAAFGFIAQSVGYTAAWLAGAGALVVAAGLLIASGRARRTHWAARGPGVDPRAG
jgi:MFS family permease